jgi:hypothetical protein
MTVRRRSDFTGDHFSDILFDDRSSGNVVEWQMSGFSIQAVQVVNSNGMIPTTFGVVDGLADFNGDGKSDLLWHDPSTGQVAFWTMNGTQVAGISGSRSARISTS